MAQRRESQITTVLAKDAHTILRKYVPPGRHLLGQFLSRLIFEHETRMEERQQLQKIETGRE